MSNLNVKSSSANQSLVSPDGKSVPSNLSTPKTDKLVELVDKKKQAILNKFGIDIDTYNKILSSNPNFLELDPASQREIVDSYRNPKPQTQYKEFDPQTYKNSTIDQKRQTRNYEFAKNIYVYGYKGNGKHTQTIPAHSEETWNNISEEERAKFVDQVVNKAKDILSNDQNLKNIYATFSNSDRKISDEKMVDIGMEALEVANANNMSIQDFMCLRDSERMDLIYNHLKSQQYNNLSESQLKRLEFYGNMKDQVAEYIKDKFDAELPKDASISQIYRIANDYNLSQEKAEYEILQKKKSRTEFEDNRYQELKDLFETPAGKDIIDKTQAAKLLRLQRKYNELLNKKQSGQKLSAEEEEQLKRLEYTMNTEESKHLFEVAKHLPKPQTEREKQIVEEWRQLNEDIRAHGNDSKIRHATQIAWLENKLASLPEDEREAYITDILKFNNGPSSIILLQHFRKDYPSLLENKFLLSENALNTDNMNSKEYKIYTDAENKFAAEAKKNGDEFELGVIYNASMTSNEILKSPRCAGAEHDDKKTINASASSELANYYDKDRATDILNSATDVNATITDAEKQLEAQQYIQNSSAYNEDVAKHEIDVLDQFHEDNRETIRNAAASYSQDVADYASSKSNIKNSNSQNNQPQVVFEQDSNNWNEQQQLLIAKINEGAQFSDCEKDLKNLNKDEKEKMIKSGVIPFTWCEQDSSLIPLFVDAGKGVQIVLECSVSTGQAAVPYIKKYPKQFAKLIAAVPTEWLSAATQADAEERGLTLPKDSGKRMNSYKA